MGKTVNSKEALFMLDEDMEQEMKSYTDEVTKAAIKHINSTPELYKFVKGNLEYKLSVKDSAITWAKNHNDEFGNLFVTELDSVDWEKVARTI